MQLKCLSRILVSVLSFMCCVAQADEAALYDEQLPEDAAFVRILGNSFPENLEFLGFQLDETRRDGRFSIVRAHMTDGLDAGQIITIVTDENGFKRFDEPSRPKNKVLVTFVNLSDTTVSLSTSDGKIPIVADIAANSIGHREVNPLKVEVAIFSGETRLTEPTSLLLRRDQHPTLTFKNEKINVTLDAINSDPLE